jgi:hypothetical protein
MKPAPGDALVWPNFDAAGKRCELSLHRALPLGLLDGRKSVVNVWFEGKNVS